MMSARQSTLLEHYKFASLLSIVIVVLATIFAGAHVIIPILALAVIEITFSFENAVVNSQVLSGMNRFWRTMFLTFGIAVAVFGVRLILPLALVSSTTGHSIGYVLDTALHQPDRYAQALQEAYPVIAAFGGVFLLMIGLRFFGEKREVRWLHTIEAPLGEFNQPWWVTILGSATAIGVVALLLADNRRTVLAAVLGAIAFITVKVVSRLLVIRRGHARGHGFSQFLYLELLDASFSFDGVIAAFAITKQVLLIAAGLGIGALYVRSITVHLLKAQTLTHYRYLIHGAHYAILALSILLLASIRIHIPDLLSGLIGLIIIVTAFEHSRRHNRRLSTVFET